MDRTQSARDGTDRYGVRYCTDASRRLELHHQILLEYSVVRCTDSAYPFLNKNFNGHDTKVRTFGEPQRGLEGPITALFVICRTLRGESVREESQSVLSTSVASVTHLTSPYLTYLGYIL